MRWLPFFALAIRLAAQVTGSIEGVVYDPAGAVVPKAELRLLETGTQATRLIVSGDGGHFLATGLPPGRYDIEARATGFRTERLRGLALSAGHTIRVDVVLSIGSVQEVVEVNAVTPLISSSASDWGGLVRGEKLESLPLNGRDLFDLAQQQPGVVLPPSAARVSLSYGTGLRFAVNGARPNQNAFRLDGVYIGDAGNNVPASAGGRSLGVEGIEEVALITSPFSAEHGRMAGAMLTAVSKSGNNQWHGSLYEYLRNSALDAKNFFDVEAKIPPFARNQFGAMLGGPAIRNRLFFLVNYEGIRERRSRTVNSNVPDALARQGTLPAAGGGTVRVNISPAIQPYLALYPLPNGRLFGDGTGEFISAPPTTTSEDYGSAKMDFLASRRWRTALRYTEDHSTSQTTDPFQLWIFSFPANYRTIYLNSQFVQSAATVHDLRFGFNRVKNQDLSTSPGVPTALSLVAGKAMGTFQVTGLSELGTSRARFTPSEHKSTDGQASYAGAFLKGRHSIKAGGGWNRVQYLRGNGTLEVGTYAFESLTAFLEGRSRSGEIVLPGSPTVATYRQDIFHLFFQDEIRLTQRLSLSLGIRYEPYSALEETEGRAVRLSFPIETAVFQPAGELYRNPSRGNLAPRVGLAWSPSSKFIIRAGFGIFHDIIGASAVTIGKNFGPPAFKRVAVLSPSFPNLIDAATRTNALPSVDVLDYEVVQPYTLQTQLQVQRQFGPGTVATFTYAANRGIHLLGFLGSVNPARPQVRADGSLFFPTGAQRLNPNFDRISMARSQFDSVHHSAAASLDKRVFRGLQFQARYAWSRTIDNSSTGNFRDYLAVDFIPNMFDYGANRGPSEFHLSHVFGYNFSWDLPAPSRLRAVFGGWRLSGLGQAQSGAPFNPRVGFDRARLLASGATGDLGQRPNLAVPGAAYVLGSPDRYFDPTAFSLPEAGTYGNLGRNVIYGPGLATIDASAQKTFSLHENHQLRLRVEVFNLANRPNFQLPSANLNLFNSTGQRVASAGRITETATSSRQIQVALRWAF